jgi:hypothetical protein
MRPADRITVMQPTDGVTMMAAIMTDLMLLAMLGEDLLTAKAVVIVIGGLRGGGHQGDCKRGRADKSYHWEYSLQLVGHTPKKRSGFRATSVLAVG